MNTTPLYSFAEVARVTAVPTATLRAWFLARTDGRGRGPVFDLAGRPSDGRPLSFLNLIDCHVASFFQRPGVSHKTIRKARRQLEADPRIANPFARSELATDGARIIRRVPEVGTPESIDAIRTQRLFRETSEGIERLDYSPDTRLATRWRVHDHVVIDPAVCLGQAVVLGTDVTTEVLWRQMMANAGDSLLVADLFGIGERQVIAANHFERVSRAA